MVAKKRALTPGGIAVPDLEPGPDSGPDCLICATFPRQRKSKKCESKKTALTVGASTLPPLACECRNTWFRVQGLGLRV